MWLRKISKPSSVTKNCCNYPYYFLQLWKEFSIVSLTPSYLANTAQKSSPLRAEAATRGVLYKKVFLEISQNSQENTYARVSFLRDCFYKDFFNKYDSFLRIWSHFLKKSLMEKLDFLCSDQKLNCLKLTLFKIDLFEAAQEWGVTKRLPPLKFVTHILQW